MLATGTSSLIGAIPAAHDTHFRVWAPLAREVEVVLTEHASRHALTAEESGYFAGIVPDAHAGDRYRYSLDGGEAFPDPASRCQPEGPHGPSEIVDSHAYRWSEHESKWRGDSSPKPMSPCRTWPKCWVTPKRVRSPAAAAAGLASRRDRFANAWDASRLPGDEDLNARGKAED